uniref:ATP synthase F0 subunit 8 n=1 Tax=Scorpiops tibetanus TaxID=500600 RepID=A0A7M3UTV5_SCOTI|nr:ATP synthase F0 subunit 8 [Scorpiops tibetanus]QOJ45411.1 ATP synthase F0 subunit 8 [Scorpiops tibetanus]
MPQMSPIGWLWIIFFTIFGYLFFLILFYYFFSFFVYFSEFKFKKLSYFWMW